MLKKSLILLIIAIMGVSMLHVFSVSAQEEGGALSSGLDTAAKQGGLFKEGDADELLAQEIGKYIRLGMGFMGIVFLIIVLYGGITWLTGGGTPKNLENAKKIISQGAIGLIVTMLAYQVTAFVIKKIGETV